MFTLSHHSVWHWHLLPPQNKCTSAFVGMIGMIAWTICTILFYVKNILRVGFRIDANRVLSTLRQKINALRKFSFIEFAIQPCFNHYISSWSWRTKKKKTLQMMDFEWVSGFRHIKKKRRKWSKFEIKGLFIHVGVYRE